MTLNSYSCMYALPSIHPRSHRMSISLSSSMCLAVSVKMPSRASWVLSRPVWNLTTEWLQNRRQLSELVNMRLDASGTMITWMFSYSSACLMCSKEDDLPAQGPPVKQTLRIILLRDIVLL